MYGFHLSLSKKKQVISVTIKNFLDYKTDSNA